MKKLNRILALLMVLVMVSAFTVACANDTTEPAETDTTTETAETTETVEETAEEPAEEATEETTDEEPATADGELSGTVAMITDIGGINDESFNQSAWMGLKEIGERGAEVSYIESQRDADYPVNIETKINEGNDLIWGIGFLMKNAVEEAALDYPEQKFALIDDVWEDGYLPNATGVTFASEQSSFLVGYIASYMTETDRVGFILGKESPTMDRFKYGYFAGVDYGAAEQGKEIQIDSVTVESFTDAALGKSTASKMYSDGADVIFHAAGNVGTGVIEAAKDADKWVIGVDLDQNHLAPDNVISSAMKNVNVATADLSARILNGEEVGGTTVHYGIEEGGVGIAPTSDKLVPADVLERTQALEDQMVAGEVVVPITEEEYNNFGN